MAKEEKQKHIPNSDPKPDKGNDFEKGHKGKQKTFRPAPSHSVV